MFLGRGFSPNLRYVFHPPEFFTPLGRSLKVSISKISAGVRRFFDIGALSFESKKRWGLKPNFVDRDSYRHLSLSDSAQT